MVNDDIERLHRFGSQLKHQSDQLPPEKRMSVKEKRTHIPLKTFLLLQIRYLKRIFKQKKTGVFLFFSYQKTCVEMKKMKYSSRQKKGLPQSSTRLIEKKLQVFNRTIIIRRRKRIHPRYHPALHYDQHQSLYAKDHSVVSSSGLFDVPISDEEK